VDGRSTANLHAASGVFVEMPENSARKPEADLQRNEPRELARRGPYSISTDSALLDVAMIHAFLSEQSYWAPGIPREVVARSIKNSLCFGLYQGNQQIGFARVVTDWATFAYLADVFVIEAFRGQELGKWLIECVLAHPDLQGLRRWLLGTRDAHGLYEQFGFTPLTAPSRFLEIYRPDI
jgi:GNAT superfamily N-acetyltransferase